MNSRKTNTVLDFSTWSRISAAMTRLGGDAREAYLQLHSVDPDLYSRSEATHMADMARRSNAGDHSLVDQHGKNIEEQFARGELADPLLATLDAPAHEPETRVFPFAEGRFVPPQLSGDPDADEVDPAGATLPLAGPKDDTLPFAQAGELRFLKLDTFAALSAELRIAPEQRDAILANHRLPSAAFLQLAQLWAKRFVDTPELRVTFESLVRKHNKEAT